jgi:hypothetical protein
MFKSPPSRLLGPAALVAVLCFLVSGCRKPAATATTPARLYYSADNQVQVEIIDPLPAEFRPGQAYRFTHYVRNATKGSVPLRSVSVIFELTYGETGYTERTTTGTPLGVKFAMVYPGSSVVHSDELVFDTNDPSYALKVPVLNMLLTKIPAKMAYRWVYEYSVGDVTKKIELPFQEVVLKK